MPIREYSSVHVCQTAITEVSGSLYIDNRQSFSFESDNENASITRFLHTLGGMALGQKRKTLIKICWWN